jgi:hypothetical protein
MSIDRNIWILPFVKERFPPWPCPHCNGGKLLLNQDTFREEEAIESIQDRNHEAWEPEWIHGLFTAYLYCSNPNCREKAVVCGSYKVSGWFDPDTGEHDFAEVLEPDFICSSPDLFIISKTCPEDIKLEIRKAFSLYWSDLDAAGNRVRTVVELLLDHLKVRKRERKKNGKYRHLSLHDRILEFHPKNPDIGEKLLAIKWLGNVGSHGNGLSKDDLIDDFEMIQFVFEELFERTRERLSTMAKKIIRKKGPIRK